MVLKLGILISGRGSNMINIVEACHQKKINGQVKIIISNNECSEGLKKVKKYKCKTKIIKPEKYKNKSNYEEKIDKSLKKSKVNLICLAGYTKILSKSFIKKWKSSIINIHPSLLPAFKGLNAQNQALNAGVKYSGCTIHEVNEELDGGKILDQKAIKINKNENLASLKKKILIEEHKLYIKVLKKISKKGKI